jgi:WD40 repeat protein
VRVYDLKTNKQIVEWESETNVSALSFSQDGTRLAIGTLEGVVHVRSLKNGDLNNPPLHKNRTRTTEVLTLAFNDTGNFLAISTKDSKIGIWNLGADEIRPLNDKLPRSHPLVSLAFQPGTIHLSGIAFDGHVHYWNAPDDRGVVPFGVQPPDSSGDSHGYYCESGFSSSGKYYFVVVGNKIQIREPRGKILQTLVTDAIIKHAYIDPSGAQIYFKTRADIENNTFQIWTVDWPAKEIPVAVKHVLLETKTTDMSISLAYNGRYYVTIDRAGEIHAHLTDSLVLPVKRAVATVEDEPVTAPSTTDHVSFLGAPFDCNANMAQR